MPMAPSLVQVPEISGCPQGVFGGVHGVVAAFAAGALVAPAGVCAAAGLTAISPASKTPVTSNRIVIATPNGEDSSQEPRRFEEMIVPQPFRAARLAGLKPCATSVLSAAGPRRSAWYLSVGAAFLGGPTRFIVILHRKTPLTQAMPYGTNELRRLNA